MKNRLCLFVAVLLLASFKNGYKLNEGIITLQFSYPDSAQVSEQMLAACPAEIKIYFKNGYTRAEYKDANNKLTIIDGKTLEGYTIYNSGMVFQTSTEDRRSDTEMMFPGYSLRTINETKDIAGFVCKKAIVTYKPIRGTQRNVDIWYTKELDVNPIDMEFKGINGFIMEYSYTDIIYSDPEAINFRKVMTCAGVEQTTVPDKLFKLQKSTGIKNMKDIHVDFK